MDPEPELTIDIATCCGPQDGFDDVHILAHGMVWQPALCDVIDCHLQASLPVMTYAGPHSWATTGCALMISGKPSSPHIIEAGQPGPAMQLADQRRWKPAAQACLTLAS